VKRESDAPGTQKTVAQSPQALASRAEPSLAEGFDRSTMERMRGFHAYSFAMAVAAIGVSFLLGGDARARHLFQLGMCWTCAVSIATVSIARSRGAWDSRIMLARWVGGGLGLLPMLYYFGPFSALTLVFPLALMFVALGRDRTTADLVVAGALGEHLLFVMPVMLGWTTDVGLVSAVPHDRIQLASLETIVLVLMAAGHVLGRWARHTRATALAELSEAKRIIGDQQQILAEVQERVEQIDRVRVGRWTGRRIGRWQIGPVLGRGAMGEVYEAEDATRQQAAVKVLAALSEDSPSQVERFHRELQIAARLDSPHIVRVLDVSAANAAVPYLAMERLRGMDLATRLRTEIRLPLNEMVGMLGAVARGLEVAHEAGVVHRDLKPQNLFLHDGTCWKILDFGVAKVFGVEGTLTQGAIVGTPQYMAPEQAAGREVTHLSDIYALGAVAYRCLTGRAPHSATEFIALVHKVVNGAPIRPGAVAQVSREIEDVLAIAMAKDPLRRFTSATEFVEQLASAMEGRRPKLEPPTDAWA
jgi:eukaryotic-like serine/threonine-protein kinase